MGPWIEFLAVPVTFVLAQRWIGLKAAIASAVVLAMVQGLLQKLRRQPLSPLFMTAAGFTILFGSMDLLVARPRFFRLEPAVHNGVMFVLFTLSWRRGWGVLEGLVRGLPAALQPKPGSLPAGYFRFWTGVLALYFLAKGVLYLFLAFRLDLASLMVVRSAVGSSSFAVIVGIERRFRQRVLGRRSKSRNERLANKRMNR